MNRILFSTLVLLLILSGTAISQEVEIDGFPVGVADGVGQDFFKPHFSALQSIADTLQKYPLTLAVVTGGADGEQYHHNHDALNPALALGRAHALRRVLIDEFGADSNRIVIQSEDTRAEGPRYRFVRVHVSWELHQLSAKVDALAERPDPVPRVLVNPVPPTPFTQDFGLQLSTGFSTTPFGGVPIAAGAVTWRRTVYAEGVVGHALWDGDFAFQSFVLDTQVRLAGGQIIFYPRKDLPVGLVGGWMRIEQLSERFYRHVRMSEGVLLGLRGHPWEFASVTLSYNPAKRWIAGDEDTDTKSDQFLLTAMIHLNLGGGK